MEVLGYFPLAIVQAGSFIAVQRPNNPVVSYLELLQGYPATVLAHRNAKAAWDYRNDTVLTTWEISYDAVSKQMPRAAKILHLCAFLRRDEIVEDLFVFGLPSSSQSEGERSWQRSPSGIDGTYKYPGIQIQQAFNLLMSYSFVQRNSDASGFSLHPLVHMWARLRLNRRDREAAAFEALQMLYRYYRTRSSGWGASIHAGELFSFYETESPCNPLDMVDLGATEPEFGQVLRGAFYWAKGMFDEAISSVYRKYFTDGVSPLRHWELFDELSHYIYIPLSSANDVRITGWIGCQAASSFGSKHPRALNVLGNYAFSLYEADEYKDSLAWYEWLLSTRTRILGASHPATAGAMLGIARATRDCDVAIPNAIEGFQRRLDILGFDDFLTRNALAVVMEMHDPGVCGEKAGESARWMMNFIQGRGGLTKLFDGVVSNLGWSDEGIKLAAAFLAANEVDDGVALIVHFLSSNTDRWSDPMVYARQLALDVVFEFTGPISHSGRVQDLIPALERLWDISRPHGHFIHILNRLACVQVSIPLVIFMLHRKRGDTEMADHWLAKLPDLSPEWLASGSCDDYGYQSIGKRLPHVYLKDVVYHALHWNHPMTVPVEAVAESVVRLIINPMNFSGDALGHRLALSGWDSSLCPASLLGSLDALDAIGGADAQEVNCPRYAFGKLVVEAKQFLEQDRSESCFQDFRRTHMCRAN